ncbi:MAG: pirin family protein [Methyloligellaceae bacterium]
MSWHPDRDPKPGDKYSCEAIETVIVPRARDIGGFEVRRALPSAKRQMVGPFIFFDQMGPVEFITGQGIDVRPHPHIGLSTITYLFDGEIVHRDSLGVEQPIRPGDVNWMTAGRGIAHSERTDTDLRKKGTSLFGIQSWVAMPKAKEESEPAFYHHGEAELPVIDAEGKNVRIVAGSLFGETAPVTTSSDMFYADVVLEDKTSIPLPAEHEERAVYVVTGEISVSSDSFGTGRLLVFSPGDEITIVSQGGARVLFFGGEPMDGPRYIWWNFVSSSKERIAQAKADWKAGRFDEVPGESEFIPLPDV